MNPVLGWLLAAVIAVCLILGGCRESPVRPATAIQPSDHTQDLQEAEHAKGNQPPQARSGEVGVDKAKLSQAPGLVPSVPKSNTTAPAQPARTKPARSPKFDRKSAIYDRKGPAYSRLQSARQAMEDFPADGLGNVDWVEALEQGVIAPRASMSGRGSMQLRTDDIIMRNTRDMPWVRFPHRQHTEWLTCSNCHPRPFREEAGGNLINMDNIMRGRQCGMCHDRVAFSIFACERCHSVTHAGSPKAWW